jgi:UDP-N-acetylglucosamine 2-epimerase (non-hydrolysing)/UDP-GlcNAc3NAcA epimerase
MRLLTIVGNRPQFVKAAAVSRRLREHHDEVLVHSGQHYDDELSAVFFRELDLPRPERELGVGAAPTAEQLAAIMRGLEEVAREVAPDMVLVYGDTTTTLAGALTAARIGLPLAHVEAGMRSFDSSMPEERNRVLTDHLSALLLCSTETAVANLRAEETSGAVQLVGDVMADVTIMSTPIAAQRSDVVERMQLEPGRYLLVTVHRAGNVDERERLELLVELLEALPERAVFPVHPRTRDRLEREGLLARLERSQTLVLTPPLGYLDFLRLLDNSRAVLTDSGGVQKEAYLLSVPCLTLRDTTEWVETVELGWNRLVGLDRHVTLDALASLSKPTRRPELYGGGHAGERVVAALEAWGNGSLRQ